MATEYTIDGVTASLAAAEQRWRPIQLGRYNHKRLIQEDWEVELYFPPCSITHMRQWCEPASAASTNVTVLNKYKTAYTDLSGVHLIVADPPALEAAVSGPFTIIIQGVTG